MFGRMLSQSLLDVFFPRSCVHCGGAVDGAAFRYLCGPCSSELFVARPPNCRTCGYPFFGMVAGPRACPHCEALDPVFDEGRTLFLAKGPGRALVHELKYKMGTYVLEDVQTLIRNTGYFLEYFENAILVPVPLHPTKLRERGYNQSELIAQAIAAASGARGVANLLGRRAYTQTQTRLSRAARQRNVKNAFALADDAAVMADYSYIIVDDVFTTGSTLNACAAVLREAGATRLKVATLGHG